MQIAKPRMDEGGAKRKERGRGPGRIWGRWLSVRPLWPICPLIFLAVSS